MTEETTKAPAKAPRKTTAKKPAAAPAASAPAPAAKRTVPHVIEAISAIAATMSMTGIAKGRENEEHGYMFRGIDQVMNTLSPVLAANRLVIIPRMLKRTQTERVQRNGSAMFSVVVEAAFDFTSAVDGSIVTVNMFGEGMDQADKATNKAMQAAYKYAAFQTFCIPVASEDADATTPAPVQPRISPEQVKTIETLANLARVSMDAVCERAKVKRIEDLHPAGFDPVVKKLNATIKAAQPQRQPAAQDQAPAADQAPAQDQQTEGAGHA